MGNITDKKFTWVIKNCSKVNHSRKFMIGGCNWHLVAYPKDVNATKHLSLFLGVKRFSTLPCGWRIRAKYRITVVNQRSHKLSHVKERRLWFDEKSSCTSYPEMISFTKLYDKDGGFLVNNQVKILVEIDVLEVIGNLDLSVESEEEANQPLKKTKLNDDGDVSTSVKERIDVNGFQVLPSQVELVNRIFERHPDIALEFRPKNQHTRTGCICLLISLIETMCKSLQKLSSDDLMEADNALTYLKCSGFKVDWLEQKLEEIKDKKKEETRMLELEEELKDFNTKCSEKEALLEKEWVELEVLKQKCLDKETKLEKEKEELKDMKHKFSDLEAMLEKEKAKVLAANTTPLMLDDVV